VFGGLVDQVRVVHFAEPEFRKETIDSMFGEGAYEEELFEIENSLIVCEQVARLWGHGFLVILPI
jgi:hypothetical protein